MKRVLWHLLGGTRGGPQRIRIILALRDRPYNTNQLATIMAADYKTIQHHLRVLVENRIIEPRGGDLKTKAYGAQFFLTDHMEDAMADFETIAARISPPPRLEEAPAGEPTVEDSDE